MNCNSQITSDLGSDYVSQQRTVENRVFIQYGDLNPSHGPQHGDHRTPCYGEPMDWKETPNPVPACPQGFRDGFCRIYDEYQVRPSADSYQFNRCHFQGNVYEQNQVDKPVRVSSGGLPAILNLPCQSSNNWDYNQCYSYYANGCYNTCQFVNVGDMEDFMWVWLRHDVCPCYEGGSLLLSLAIVGIDWGTTKRFGKNTNSSHILQQIFGFIFCHWVILYWTVKCPKSLLVNLYKGLIFTLHCVAVRNARHFLLP